MAEERDVDSAPQQASVPLPSAPQRVELAPTRVEERLAGLDVLRGVALLGIFMVNMQFFAMPFARAVYEPQLKSLPAPDQIAWALVKAFFEYKFITMFSMMFGAGAIVLMSRAAWSRRSWAAVYGRRLIALILLGLCHGLLLWYGDILFAYGAAGVVLLLLWRIPARALLLVACIVLATNLILEIGMGALQALGGDPWAQAAQPPGETTPLPPTTTAGQAATAADTQPASNTIVLAKEEIFNPISPGFMAAEIEAYRHGPFSEALKFRAISFGITLVFFAFSYGWRIVGMFLLGAALMKMNFFSAERRSWHARLAIAGLLVGVPAELLGTWMTYAHHREIGAASAAGAAALHSAGSLALCLGYAGLVLRLASSGWAPALQRAFAAVGRMSLSNYLLQTLVATAIMYWWGLGQFNEFSRIAQVGLVLVIYAAQAVLSLLWLQWFSIGPVEWLLRAATYLRRPRLLRVP
jgi:uncharacterized protein